MRPDGGCSPRTPLGVSLTRHHDAAADALAVVDVALALDALAEVGGRESVAA